MANPVKPHPGKVYLVGAGPGDADLITVKALQLIESAEVIVYDALANAALLNHAREEAELIDAGKRAGCSRLSQDEINEVLADRAAAGALVVRLKGGDPYVFGRGAEEAIYLHERGIEVEVVPGITAAAAAGTYAGIPLTHRHLATTCTLVTGHEDPHKAATQVDFAALAQLASTGGTLCFYMGMGRLPVIVEQLTRHGLPADTPAAIVQWATRADQRSLVAPLSEIHPQATAAGISAPAIVLVGSVVGLNRRALNWFEQRPLFGQTLVVTRTRQQASQLRIELERRGAQVIEAPTIEILEPEDWGPVIEAVRDLAAYDWLVLTSANGVVGLAAMMESLGMDGRDLAAVKIAVTGRMTADVLRQLLGVNADLVPDEHIGEALARQMIDTGPMRGRKVLMLRADIARPDLPERLEAAGALVDDLAIYRTRRADALPEDLVDALKREKIDWLTFTSSSTVRNFIELLGDDRELIRAVRIASIGPATSATVREFGFSVAVEAADHTVEGLVATLQAMGVDDTRADPPH